MTGVMKEMPSNSHIHYNFLISYKSLGQYLHDYWYKHEVYTYVLLDSPERKEEIEKAFPAMSEKYKTDEALKNKIWGVSLTPLADIHLKPQVGYEAEIKGNRTAMIALIFAAIAILAIALDQLYQPDCGPLDGTCQGGRSAPGNRSFPQAACISILV